MRSRSTKSKVTSLRRGTNIREVAKAARTSVATVSRALRFPDVVAPDTRKRVLESIARLGYAPNAQARILRTARTNLIVALVPDIANPFFSEIIRGIEQVAHEHGYSVLLGDTQHSGARETAYANLISTRQADGLITLLPHVPEFSTPGRKPVVNACEYVRGAEVTTVRVDNTAATRDATEYLIALGHTRIAFVSGPTRTQISLDRLAGFESALTKAGLAREAQLTVTGDFSVESGIRCVESLFGSGSRFTAVVCSNDEMAMGVVQGIKAQGLRVPGDVSVVGFDDIRFSRFLDPPLTTVAQPMGDLGREAMTLLLEIMQDGTVPVRERVLSTQLIVRGSTARPPAKTRTSRTG